MYPTCPIGKTGPFKKNALPSAPNWVILCAMPCRRRLNLPMTAKVTKRNVNVVANPPVTSLDEAQIVPIPPIQK